MKRRVSLILPVSGDRGLPADTAVRCRDALTRSGYEVEVVAAADTTAPLVTVPLPDDAVHARAWTDGLAASVMAGLTRASGDVLLVVDPHQPYHPDDLALVVRPVAEGRSDLVVARAHGPVSRGLVPRALGLVTRPWLGTSDPFAGLVAVSPDLASSVAGTFTPVGSRFTLDLLLRAKGRREEVAVRTEGPGTVAPLGFDDLRHVKRLADDRFGNASRLIQFCAVGASGMVIDLTCYALFQLVFSRTALAAMRTPVVGGSLALAAAGAVSIGLALVWNFSLNRRLTFSYARDGSIARQFLTYALSNALGIGLSLTLRLWLPQHVEFFRQHKLAAAVVGIVAATGVSFSLARWVVFRSRPRSDVDYEKACVEPVEAGPVGY